MRGGRPGPISKGRESLKRAERERLSRRPRSSHPDAKEGRTDSHFPHTWVRAAGNKKGRRCRGRGEWGGGRKHLKVRRGLKESDQGQEKGPKETREKGIIRSQGKKIHGGATHTKGREQKQREETDAVPLRDSGAARIEAVISTGTNKMIVPKERGDRPTGITRGGDVSKRSIKRENKRTMRTMKKQGGHYAPTGNKEGGGRRERQSDPKKILGRTAQWNSLITRKGPRTNWEGRRGNSRVGDKKGEADHHWGGETKPKETIGGELNIKINRKRRLGGERGRKEGRLIKKEKKNFHHGAAPILYYRQVEHVSSIYDPKRLKKQPKLGGGVKRGKEQQSIYVVGRDP